MRYRSRRVVADSLRAKNIEIAARGSRVLRAVVEAMEPRVMLTAYTASSPTQLIADINAANTAGGSNSITLASNMTVSSTPDNDWYGPNAFPAITSNLTIDGNGATISCSIASETTANAMRFFYVSGGMSGLSAGTLTLENLTLSGGLAKGGDSWLGGGALGAGGAIFNQGDLTLDGVTLTDNTALGGSSADANDGDGGGGMGQDATGDDGGGFGGSFPVGTYGGDGAEGVITSAPYVLGPGETLTQYTETGGGGGGFSASTSGESGAGDSGLGGNSDSANGGDGGAGGSYSNIDTESLAGAGGDFGGGGQGTNNGGGGGGGVGGGGGDGIVPGAGGFGGGGGFGNGGAGGFGGGGGGGDSDGNAAGFGGGNGAPSMGGGGGGGLGGAIFNMYGSVTVINSTVAGNLAQGGNATYNDNSGYGGSGYGGGIFNLDGTVNLTFATIARNTVTAGTGDAGNGSADGGAVYNLAYGNNYANGNAISATVNLADSILAGTIGGTNDLVSQEIDGNHGNAASVTATAPNIVIAARNAGHGTGTSTLNADTITGVTNSTLDLASGIADNGGPTETLALESGSAAVGKGSAVGGITTDQRGYGARLNPPDIGAFQTTFQPTISTTPQPTSAPVNTTISAVATVTGGDDPTGTVTFDLYNNSTASSTPLFTDTESLSSGTATSASYTALSPGTDYWVATYNGDSNNASISTGAAAEPVTITGSLVVNTAADPVAPVPGETSLREALAYASSLGAGTHAITFDPTVFATAQTITLSSTLGALAPSDPTGTITITGPSAGVTISGNNAVTDFVIDSGTVALSNLTISHGYSDTADGAGGIYNDATLTITGCTFSNDSAGGYFGGGINNGSSGTLGTLTVSDSTFTNDSAGGGDGGGINNVGGALIVSGSTFTNDSAGEGGGIYTQGFAAITNCTFYNNQASSDGGGIFGGSFTLLDSTLTDNSAGNGGGIEAGGTPTLGDTIVAGNTSDGDYGRDIFGIVKSIGNNLIGNGDDSGGLTNGVSGDQVGTEADPINPLLGTLGNYGGATQTVPLLPGSPAIGAGNTTAGASTIEQITVSGSSDGSVQLGFEGNYITLDYADAIDASNLQQSLDNLLALVDSNADVDLQAVSGQNQAYVFNVELAGDFANEAEPLFTVSDQQDMAVAVSSLVAGGPITTDQTGYTRSTTAPSIGAYENEGFTITASGGATQSTDVSTAFGTALGVSVASNNALLTDLAGGTITFTAPAQTGASATFSPNPITLASDGTGSTTATANATSGGPYTVSASASGIATPADFSLTNSPAGSLLVNTTSDAADPGLGLNTLRQAIAYADQIGGGTITFAQSLKGETITLDGSALVVSDTANPVVIDASGIGGITINGNNASTVFENDDYPADVTLKDLTITGGKSIDGGGILNNDNLTIINCTITGNSATLNGGGICQLDAFPTLTITNSTITGNSAENNGGGIFDGNNGTGGSDTIVDSTIVGNIADEAADFSDGGAAVTTVNNSIISDFEGAYQLNLSNSLFGPFSAATLAANGTSGIISGVDGNIIVNSAAALGLGTLGNYGGATETIPLLPGSPAIGAGVAADYPGTTTPITTDQRGVTRSTTSEDIGAFQSQGFTISIIGGNSQTTAPSTTFATPLGIQVTANDPVEPVAGGTVTFSAPTTGASASFTTNPITLGTGGTASTTATANSTAGGYSVTASATGIATAATFTLTNSSATPAITSSQEPASADIGSSIADKATVTGGDDPTGTVTFDLYSNDTATGTPLFTDTEPLVSGTATSAGYTAASAGTDYWVDTYNGDSNNSTITSGPAAEPVTISSATTSLTGTPSATAVTLSTTPVTLKDTADLSGAVSPTGSITFTLYDGVTLVDTETVTVTADANYTTPAGYTLPTSSTVTGTYQWDVSYSGDGNNSSASDVNAVAEQVVVSAATPTITSSAQPTSATVGTSIADLAAVTGYHPSGTVTFNLYSNATASGTPLFTDTESLSTGTATSKTFTTTTPGTDYWVATYNGDGNNISVTSGVAATPVTITSNASVLADSDIGSPAKAGSASYNSATGVWTVSGGGADIWNNSDQFNFDSTTISGDATLIAEVTSLTDTDPWAKAGLMFRDGSAAGTVNVAVVATPGNGVSFQWRTTAGGISNYTNIPSVPLPTASNPVWLKLVRSGNTFTAYYSTNGTSYTEVGAETITMDTALLGGLAVTAHNNALIATATFANVAIPYVAAPVPTPAAPTLTAVAAPGAVSLSWMPVAGATTYDLYRSTISGGEGSTPYLTGLTGTTYSDTSVTPGTKYYYTLTAVNSALVQGPASGEVFATPTASTSAAGLSDADIGLPGLAGSASYNSTTGVWTVVGGGTDIWGNSDQFNFASTPISGNATLIAEVTSLTDTDPWAKAGLMLRDGSAANAVNVAVVATPGNGVSFQWRTTAGGISNYTNISSVPAPTASNPVWLKLVRSGNTFTAYYSTNGTTYTEVGAQTITMDTALAGGLAVTAHNNSLRATATFANVAIPYVAAPVPVPVAPTITAIAAAGSVSLSWSTVANAVTYDLYRSTTPGGEGSTPYLTGLTGTTYSNTAVTPGVKYYYTLTAVNSAGVQSTQSLETSATPTPPNPALTDTDIGSPGLAGSASYNSATGVWTVAGGGSDIWNNSDQFNFDSTTVSGNATLTTEVTSLTDTDPWAKAGLMLRDGSAANAANVAVVATPGNGVSFQWRSTAGGSSSYMNVPVAAPTASNPVWLKLVRSGNVFTAYYSTNGTTYTLVGSETITMDTGLLGGLAVTAHNNSLRATATFANVSV